MFHKICNIQRTYILPLMKFINNWESLSIIIRWISFWLVMRVVSHVVKHSSIDMEQFPVRLLFTSSSITANLVRFRHDRFLVMGEPKYYNDVQMLVSHNITSKYRLHLMSSMSIFSQFILTLSNTFQSIPINTINLFQLEICVPCIVSIGMPTRFNKYHFICS